MRNPWSWIPSLYFAEALPYVAVMSIATIMYARLGLTNTEVAFYTSWLYLPWVIKPFWSPLVEMFGTKRRWVVAMQVLIGAGLAGVAFTLPMGEGVRWSLAFFWLVAFSSATHDIAADGFYIDALDSHEQTLFVGIRSTFYRIATIVAQGGLVWFAGTLETFTRRIAYSWSLTFYLLAGVMIALYAWHTFALPRPTDRHKEPDGGGARLNAFVDYLKVYLSFFVKPQVVPALLFMLLYRFPEALLVKICPLFLIDSEANGGMGLTTAEVGFVQGTVGVMGLTIGGILGGIVAARHGLKRWLWPMVLSITLPDIVYVVMCYAPGMSIEWISLCIFVEQFGYGFGFTAYMLYLLYYSRGKYATAHYAFCTGFMALSMMLPGLFAGLLSDTLGYAHYFILVMGCCAVTFLVTAFLRIDPSFGKKSGGLK